MEVGKKYLRDWWLGLLIMASVAIIAFLPDNLFFPKSPALPLIFFILISVVLFVAGFSLLLYSMKKLGRLADETIDNTFRAEKAKGSLILFKYKGVWITVHCKDGAAPGDIVKVTGHEMAGLGRRLVGNRANKD